MENIPSFSENIIFPKEEKKILEYWSNIKAFENSLKQSEGRPRYTFYDGPPFATGKPHYGHILTGTIKDVITRYAHQQGHHVDRRFGWDCHGLPVEYEIDNLFHIKSPEDVAQMGIKTYNENCRKIVTRYTKDWEITMTRLGRWVNFQNDYKTMYPWFMESVWWAFKEIYSKGLVYQGNKIMPYSTGCCTPLSNFEAGQNYKDSIDPAVTIGLKLINDKDEAELLVWTTTPWTLPSNLAACVNPKYIYAKIRMLETGKVYIMVETRVETLFKHGKFEIINRSLGENLKDLQYMPLFPYFGELKDKGAFRVLVDNYVTQDSGTGIVHLAPYFGEEDLRVCLKNGIITKDQTPVCPIDATGKFTDSVPDFKGQYIKDADKNIIAILNKHGRLVNHTQIKHSYPYCWRSETPLIYRAIPSWFIKVEHLRDKLKSSCDETRWVPDFIKEKRFKNWLADARDWAVSRNRYWGTPIPIWINNKEIICIGSIRELEELTGREVTDLHRENIDDLEIPSKIKGNPPLKRINEVFDCWFESGCMPYAQQHYPFENFDEFQETFPADFIAEGIDQTRGWFYTLIVISTILFEKAPFKNLIASGLVLAADGQKMSKSKKNYPDPNVVIESYGADALRLYLITSPVVRADNLKFKEEGVRDIVKDVLLPWYNSFRFLLQNIKLYSQNNEEFIYSKHFLSSSSNIMDKWVLSSINSLIIYVNKQMSLYQLYNVVPKLTNFIDMVTNWYIRMNRKRFKGNTSSEDCKVSLTILFNVIFNLLVIMAPFAPFLSEYMYQSLKEISRNSEKSVHYLMLPKAEEKYIDTKTEQEISGMQRVIDLGRILRDRKALPLKYPLPEIIIVYRDQKFLNDILSLREYILFELNVKNIEVTTDKNKYGISLHAEPNYKVLGNKLKGSLKTVSSKIKGMSNVEIEKLVEIGYVEIDEFKIESFEVKITFKSENLQANNYEIHSDNDIIVLLNVTPDKKMEEEGISREIVNRVQKLRKKAKLVPSDEVFVYYKTSDLLETIATQYKAFIQDSLKTTFEKIEGELKNIIIEDTQNIKGVSIYIVLSK